MNNRYKVVIFDFDGTLTYSQKNIWMSIWQMLGYDVSSRSYCANLFIKFLKKEITHEEWGNLTCKKFQEKGFSLEMLNGLADSIKLLPGIKETFNALQDNQIEIYILSGNIRQVIIQVLKSNGLIKFFNSMKNNSKSKKIFANEIVFDRKSHVISYFKGTKYDFEGKAQFIEELKTNKRLSSNDILYVCDHDDNDKWVGLSCCNVLYINSSKQENNYKIKGSIPILNVSDIRQILPQIFQI